MNCGHDHITRFLFETLEVRGAFTQLHAVWQSMQENRHYGTAESRVLGEMAAVTVLVAAQLKQPGRLTFQLRGEGPISFLLVDCDEQLRIRGMVRAQPGIQQAAFVSELLGASKGGQLMLSLDTPSTRKPYQSFVPLEGTSIAAIFEHYLSQSEQQESFLLLAASEKSAAGLFLQKMPGADEKDADGWDRLRHLAATAREDELLNLDAASLLQRLFHEEIREGKTSGQEGQQGLRVFPAQSVVYHCPENREKIVGILRAMGDEELKSILAQHGEIRVKDDICNREYCFLEKDLEQIFAASAVH